MKICIDLLTFPISLMPSSKIFTIILITTILYLQVGWNGSVPTCVDSEPPAFVNCPHKEILVKTDKHGQLLPVSYEVPRAKDNSAKVGIYFH